MQVISETLQMMKVSESCIFQLSLMSNFFIKYYNYGTLGLINICRLSKPVSLHKF